MKRREFITLPAALLAELSPAREWKQPGMRVTMVGSSSRLNLRFGMAVPMRIFLELPYSFDLGKRFA